MCKMCALLNSIIFIVQNTAIEIIFNPNEALRSIAQTCPLYNNPHKITTLTTLTLCLLIFCFCFKNTNFRFHAYSDTEKARSQIDWKEIDKMIKRNVTKFNKEANEIFGSLLSDATGNKQENDLNDNLEEAKVWAKNQKKSF